MALIFFLISCADSLGKFFEDQFGSVEDAHVVRIRSGDELQSRGFGFVTFKHEKSVSKAVQAHYVTIMGKQIEIKSAVSEMTAEEIPTRKSEEEAKADQISRVNKLLHCQRKTCSDFQPFISPISDNHNIPVWLRTFKKWLPRFLEEVSKKPKEGEHYPLSSLKADFRAAFGLELNHASMGYAKLSDFVKSFPDLCHMKLMPVGGHGSANHMVLMPCLHRPGWKTLQQLILRCLPSDDNTDTDSNDSKYPQDLSNSLDNVSVSSGEVDPSKIASPENSAPKDTRPVAHLQFLNSEHCLTQPKLYNETKSQTENANDERAGIQGLNDRKFSHRGRHLVLEALMRNRNNSSLFFLREYDFYHVNNKLRTHVLYFIILIHEFKTEHFATVIASHHR